MSSVHFSLEPFERKLCADAPSSPSVLGRVCDKRGHCPPAAVQPPLRDMTGGTPPLSRTRSRTITCVVMWFGARGARPVTRAFRRLSSPLRLAEC